MHIMNPLTTLNALSVARDAVAILWLGQNSYVLKTSQGTRIAIDPYLTRDPRYHYLHPEPPVTPDAFHVEYVFCTHDHWDHTDPTALPFIATRYPHTRFLGPPESCTHLHALGVNRANVQPLQAKTTYRFDDVTVTPFYSIPPRDATTTHLGFLFQVGSTKIYNMGDTSQTVVCDPHPILDPVANATPHVAMFPIIGDTPERTPTDAYTFATIVQPAIAVPCHYDCFSDRTIDPDEFVRLFRYELQVTPVVIPYSGILVYPP